MRSAHVHLNIAADEPAPVTVAAHDFHNGGRIPTGDVLVVMQERLGLGVTLSGTPDDLVAYLESGIAAIRATRMPLAPVA
ncbi:MAG TPA: hypothetical protein VH112_01915 [Acidimicrobiales bacterium]|nr:hypothetical protein [Acidimicrobiales bacterium]